MKEGPRTHDFDWILLAIVSAICLMGMLEIWSATHDSPMAGMHWRQAIWIGVGFIAMIPFFVTDEWKGPIARLLGGADIAMLIGLPVAAGVYLWAYRSFDLAAEERRAQVADAGLDAPAAATGSAH